MQPEALIDKTHAAIAASIITLGTSTNEEVKILVISQLGELINAIKQDPQAKYVIDPSLVYDISYLIEKTFLSLKLSKITSPNITQGIIETITAVAESAMKFNHAYRQIRELR